MAVTVWAVEVVVAVAVAVVLEDAVAVAEVVTVWAVAVILEDAVAVAVWAVGVVVAVVATRAVARVSVARAVTRARANQCSALESLVMTGIRGEMITILGETTHGAIHLVAVSAKGLRCMVAVKVHHLHRLQEKTDGGKVLLRSSLHLPDLEVPRRSCHSMGAQVLRRFSLRSWALAT